MTRPGITSNQRWRSVNMLFIAATNPHHRHAYNASEEAADKIERAVIEMGLAVRRESSRISASQYVYVAAPAIGRSAEDDDGEIKVRVSDHKAHMVGDDYHVACDNRSVVATGYLRWYECIEQLAALTGLPVPAAAKAARTHADNAAAKAARQEAANAERRARLATKRAEIDRMIIEYLKAHHADAWRKAMKDSGRKARKKRASLRNAARKALGLPSLRRRASGPDIGALMNDPR